MHDVCNVNSNSGLCAALYCGCNCTFCHFNCAIRQACLSHQPSNTLVDDLDVSMRIYSREVSNESQRGEHASVCSVLCCRSCRIRAQLRAHYLSPINVIIAVYVS